MSAPKNSSVLEAQKAFEYPWPRNLLPPHLQNLPGEPAGDKKDIPHLFRPLKNRSLTLKNRIVVSPMCQYSSPDGYLTDWHLRHLGNFAVGGAALVICEATAVAPEGRITPYCAGIYHQAHVASFKRVVDFIHANGALAGIQLAHAGRKASTLPPFLGGVKEDGPRVAHAVGKEFGGWPEGVLGASAIAWEPSGYFVPKEISKAQIPTLLDAWTVATKRADEAGFDLIEIHGAHGYLISSWLSPLSNQRTDEYGGSFENRIRFPLEIVRTVRKAWPSHKPLWFRVSTTEWVPGGWDVEDTIAFAKRLKEEGVDLLDCSSGGNDPRQKISPLSEGTHMENPQIDLAEIVKKAVPGLLIGAVGNITSPKQAENILAQGKADVTLIARQIQREPYWPVRAARDLGVDVGWAPQIAWGSKLKLGQDDRALWRGHSKL